MKTGSYFICRCTKRVPLSGAETREISFSLNRKYKNTFPEFWPDHNTKVCLIDNQGDNHYMDWKWFHEHFEIIERLTNS